MHDLLPIIAVTLIFGPPSAFLFSMTPIGKALTHRLKNGSGGDGEKTEELQNAIHDLQDMVERVGFELEDLQDRVAFAERLISSGKERERTPV